MDKVNILTRFISSVLDVNVFTWDGQMESLHAFEARNCFLPKMQPQLTAEALELLLGALKKQVIYEIHDALSLRVFLLRYEDQAIIIGPFVEEQWDDIKAREVMAKLKIPISYELSYKMYYCGYNENNIQTVSKIIHAAISSFDPHVPVYNHRTITGLQSEEVPNIIYDDPPVLDIIEARYRLENEFMRMIQQGNPSAAVDVYKKLSFFTAGLYTAMPDIQTSLISAAIARTLMRKSAEQAGLQPIVVDSISQACVQKLNAAKSPVGIGEILQDLSIEYSKAVRDMRKENFSPHVRKAADYIKLQLSKPLSLDEISNVLGISSNHLSFLFRKEAGMSISQYIAERRCSRAGELLLATGLTVQDISASVGYLDSNYFVKVFKSCFGTTPTEYRKKNKSHPISKK